jgi:hypothetical protein
MQSVKTSSPPKSLDSSTRDQFSSKLLMFILLVFPSLVLLLHSYLGGYTRLIADDLCSFYFARRLDMLRYVWYWYLNWGGRYSAFAIDSLIDNIGAKGISYFPVTLLIIWVSIAWLTFYVLLQVEIGKAQSTLRALAMGVTTVFAVLSISPNVPQVLYWWNGMRTYLPSLIVATFYIGFLYWAQRNLKTRRAILLGSVLSFTIAFLDGGFNESLCVVLFSFFIGLTAFRILTRTLRFNDPFFSFLFAAILGTTLALLIMLMSPGTALRQVFFPPPPGLVRMFEITANGYLGYLADLFRSPKRASALIALVFTSIWMGTESNEKLSHRYWIIVSILGGILLSFASILPSVYGTSEMAHPRTLIVPSFILAASLVYAGLMTGKWLSGNRAILSPVQSGLMLCVGISIVFSTWINAKALYESRDTYISFAERWDQADAQIIGAKLNGDTSVTIAALDPWTGPGGDPTDNPKFWVTHCYSLYYGFPVFGPRPEVGGP